MKNKKIVTLLATLGLVTCLYTKVDAVKFYDTLGTRYEGAVERLGELEIIKGISDKTFAPNKTVTRAEFAKMIVEATLTPEQRSTLVNEGLKLNFKDVSKNAWYYDYIVIAVNHGYINGFGDNTFRPDENITYEQAAKIFMRALGHLYLVETNSNGWSYEYMEKLYALNIADYTTEFEKSDPATRGNIAIMLWNTLTSNVWKRVELNDTNGFTYVDSGETLFNKKIDSWYAYRDGFKINGFKEINGILNVKLDDYYYPFHDQEATVLFTMLGGKADALFKYIRYPQSIYRDEVIGLTSDIGAQLYSGTLDELKAEYGTLRGESIRVSSKANYGYLIDGVEKPGEQEKSNDRSLIFNGTDTRFYVEKIKIDTKKESVEKDDEYTVKKIKDKADENNYIYMEKYEYVTKTITINEDYVINDGAVLFENNKRVQWDTVKAGDVITEIKKDQYYFVSREKVEAVIKDYNKNEDGSIDFSTSKGKITIYNNADYIGYYANNEEVKFVKRIKDSELKSLIGIKVFFDLDFSGRAVKMEVLENNKKEEEAPPTYLSGLKELGVGYYSAFNESGNGNYYLSLFFGEKEKTYRTTLKGIRADRGDMLIVTFNENNVITDAKVASGSSKINDKFSLKKSSYEVVKEALDNGEITDKMPIFTTKYLYDFGEYDKIIDFKVSQITKEEIDDFDLEKSEYYVATDTKNNIRLVIIMDYSEKKDVFYGKVINIFTEDKKLKMHINIFEHKNLVYEISGRVNCEEGDVISFKIVNGNKAIEVLEKYTTEVLGYYKDIIIKEASLRYGITTENGEIDLEDGTITTGKEVHKMSQYEIILIQLKKDDKGNWYFNRGDILKTKDVELQTNDRIAINEIEDTIIIYRGYKD